VTRLVTFTTDMGETVAVNPERVAYVERAPSNNTMINFSALPDDHIIVKMPFHEASEVLRGWA